MTDNAQEITIISCNAAVGNRQMERQSGILGEAIASESPTFVLMQEHVVCKNGDRVVEDTLEELSVGLSLANYMPILCPTVDSQNDPCPRIVPRTKPARPGKWFSSRFQGYTFAAQGNGFFIHNSWEVVDFWNNGAPPKPLTFTISQPGLFSEIVKQSPDAYR